MMAKRMQEQKEEERIVSKPKSTAMNSSSHVPASSSTAKIPIASKSPGILTATGKTESRMRKNSKSDAASCSQVKLQDAYLGGLMEKEAGKPVATDESQELWEFSESETWSLHEAELTWKPVAYKTVTGKLVASSKSDQPGSPKAAWKEWPHNLHISPGTVHHMEAVFSIVRNIKGREHDDPVDDLDVNAAIWGIFLNTTFQAAVHLGQDYEANVRYVKNHFWSSVGQLFNETGKSDQWTNWNHWCDHDWVQRFNVAVDRLVVQPSLSDHPRQSLRLLPLCALCGKNRRWSDCDLEEPK